MIVTTRAWNEEREKESSGGGVRDTLLWGGRKSIVCDKVPRLRPLVLPVRVRVKVKALEWLEAVA
jgi:hypothetical protein